MTGKGDSAHILPVGKVPPNLLDRLLREHGQAGDRVVLKPGIGIDATVVEIDGHLLAVKVDPITFATDEIGWYAVHVNANDVAVVGARPTWFLATLLLPENKTTEGLIEDIFRQTARACEEVGAALVGGHTEITFGLDRPIVAGCMIGHLSRQEFVRPGLIEPGDEILVARGIAIEATALIAREFANEVEHQFGKNFAIRCRRFLHEPGISVVKAARLAITTGWVHAMHDPTEGGLLTGLWELAEAAGLGLEVNLDRVRVYPETKALCDHFGLDPLGVIASGSLVVAVHAGKGGQVTETLKRGGIPASVIGHFTDKLTKVAIRAGQPTQLIPCERDEIAKLFERA